MIECVVIVPVAADDASRLLLCLESIKENLTHYFVVVLLDGISINSIDMEKISIENIKFIQLEKRSYKNWSIILENFSEGLRFGLSLDDLCPDAIFLKIDADAVIVREGLSGRVKNIFRTRPAAGLIGQCYSNVLGQRLHNHGWINFFKKVQGISGFRHFLTSRDVRWCLQRRVKSFLFLKKIIKTACNNGYNLGEFPIGGSYILSRTAAQRLISVDILSRSPFFVFGGVGEDVCIGLFVYCVGFSLVDESMDGGIFAIEGKELRVSPHDLKARGNFIVHPIKYGYKKNDIEMNEYDLFNFLVFPDSL